MASLFVKNNEAAELAAEVAELRGVTKTTAVVDALRKERDDASRETPGLRGLYPVGEGAGYAGGIVSAAVDGLRSARAVIAEYAPLD